MAYDRIRELREERGLKQKELAHVLHCSQQVYSNYELGKGISPPIFSLPYPRFTKCR